MTGNYCGIEKIPNLSNMDFLSFSAKSPASTIPAFVVYAGLEPKVFTNLFPYWEHTEEAETANLKVGYHIL